MKRLHGFTLIETVVVIAILSVVGLSLSSTILYFYRTNAYVIQEGTAVQSAQSGLGTAMKNLREASYGDDGSYPIQSAATSSLIFFADVNGDGHVDKIHYYLSGTTLYRGITQSTSTPPTYVGQSEVPTILALYVVVSTSTPIFQYADNTGTLLTVPFNVSQIASVTTSLKIDVDPNRSPTPYSLLGSATLRNLRN